MARLAPMQDSTVRRISSSRAWVSTMMVTSSGMRFSSTSMRTKSKSVCEADGKPTSISFTPICTSFSKKRSFFSGLIGSIRAWLPSRRSVLIQIGGWVMMRFGHWRSASGTAGKGRYLAAGLVNMAELLVCVLVNTDVGDRVARAAGRATKR
jgi:hypothetical protein